MHPTAARHCRSSSATRSRSTTYNGAHLDQRLHQGRQRAPPRHTTSPACGLLGTVGEPINPEAWVWYWKTIGGGRCTVVDTWWQNENGGIMIAPLTGSEDCQAGIGDPAACGHPSGCVWNDKGNPVAAGPRRLPGAAPALAGHLPDAVQRRRAVRQQLLRALRAPNTYSRATGAGGRGRRFLVLWPDRRRD